jgi:N-hydroxyarylamine O-acetyltransferase
MSDTTAYLARLGLDVPPPPTLDTLFLLHRRHLERVPYENLAIMLGRPPSVDAAASLGRVGEVGRAGYCFHQNGALELALRELGYDVSRRHGHVWTDESTRFADPLNHLVLVASGLPTDDNPVGEWWVDVGLGDGFREPLPIVEGEYQQDGFRYRIEEVRDDGWSFRHDPSGTFGGVEVTSRPTDPAAVLRAHSELCAPGVGQFARLLVVQRRHGAGVTTLRGCLLHQVTAAGTSVTVLDTYDAWRAGLVDLGLPLGGIDDVVLRSLFERTLKAHLLWVAAGSP